jgi:hypothetical protein
MVAERSLREPVSAGKFPASRKTIGKLSEKVESALSSCQQISGRNIKRLTAAPPTLSAENCMESKIRADSARDFR